MDLSTAGIQALLFTIFAALTGILGAIIGPTYDNLLVPELAPASLYPSLGAAGGGAFLGTAAAFSDYLVVNLVDPALGLVGLAVALAYLGRAFLGRWAVTPEPLLARLLLAVVLANFSLPVAGAILDVAAATYPIIAGFDRGAWQHWSSLDGIGGLQFSWDNGALAFVVTFAMFSIVLLLVAAVALRNALLAVLVVLLPLFTLVWPIPPLAPLARRGWLLFGELAFLPCVLIVPLELAVGTPSVLLLLGFLTVALSSPSLVSLAGAHLTQSGFPSGGPALTGGVQRGLSVASSAAGAWFRPLGRLVTGSATTREITASVGRTLGAASFPAAAPLIGAELLGRGAAHLVRHLRPAVPGGPSGDRFPGRSFPRGGASGG